MQGYTKEGVLNADPAAKIDLKTIQETDITKINAFVKSFDLNLTLGGTIGDMIGKSIKIDITTVGGEKGTYTFAFQQGLDLTDSVSGDEDIRFEEADGVGAIMTGDSLKDDTDAAKAKTADEVKKMFAGTEGATVEILTSEETPVEAAKPVGTGCKILLKNGDEIIDVITVVVAGDLDGEGDINAADAVKVLNSMGSGDALEGAYLQAALLTQDSKEAGSPTAADAVMILNVAAAAASN